MRMDQTQGETAAERLAEVDEADLADVIFQFGEERNRGGLPGRSSARARQAPLETTGQLAASCGGRQAGPGWQRIDPATRTFQALRIWVNGELDGLDGFLRRAAARLRAGARLAVISFHSLEDRIVKHTLRALDRADGLGAGPDRQAGHARRRRDRPNPRARSAKLRVAERLA